MFGTSSIFVPKSLNIARSKFGLGTRSLFLTAKLGSNSLVHILKKLELALLGKFTARANTKAIHCPNLNMTQSLTAVFTDGGPTGPGPELLTGYMMVDCRRFERDFC